MGKGTKIAYCDDTVNPVVGCDGCELLSKDRSVKHCYADTLVNRHAGLKGWPTDFFEPKFFPGRLEQAIWRKPLQGTGRLDKPWLNGYPRIIFVGDLADIFAKNTPDPMTWLAPNIIQMGTSIHIWLLLTKRPGKLVEFAKRIGGFPANFWLGTTITNQNTSWRAIQMQQLRDVSPKSKIWYSLEPLIGPVDLGDSIEGDWLVLGAMSGKNAVPMDIAWARAVKDWCSYCGMPFFFKQAVGSDRSMISTPCLDGVTWTQMPEVNRV